jgi:hypothetical protein
LTVAQRYQPSHAVCSLLSLYPIAGLAVGSSGTAPRAYLEKLRGLLRIEIREFVAVRESRRRKTVLDACLSRIKKGWLLALVWIVVWNPAAESRVGLVPGIHGLAA